MSISELINFDAMRYIGKPQLLDYVNDTPIMPNDIEVNIRDSYAQGLIGITTLAMTLIAQTLVVLPDSEVGDMRSIQRMAREQADHFLTKLSPKIIAIYTYAKQFCNFITVFNDNDIDQLIDGLAKKTEDGKNQFLEVINAFKQEMAGSTKNLTTLLEDFDQLLANLEVKRIELDLINAVAIKKYKNKSEEIESLKEKMSWLYRNIQKQNAIIAAFAQGQLKIITEKWLKFSNEAGKGEDTFIIGSYVTSKEKESDSRVEEAIHAIQVALYDYKMTSKQFDELQSTCNRLADVSDQLQGLTYVTIRAIQAIQNIAVDFNRIALNLQALADHADIISQSSDMQLAVKEQLKKFLSDAVNLHNVAKLYEERSIFSVEMDKALGCFLHPGQNSVSSYLLSMEEYLSLIRKRNLLERLFSHH